MALDPAIVKMAGKHSLLQPAPMRPPNAKIEMHANRQKYFRWTPRTAGITLMYVAVVPICLGFVAYKTDVSFTPWRKQAYERLTAALIGIV
jgi:hypothetical protein